ncbi:hypothetical protein C7974DRAFT_196058 [Boeremia exigua]|uniref:uncharacterized protein n=1 Tax=Boeremia exigua TaxID=749465 RepID=UPI001E8DF693|nr:uncharacterized protein C7974DRAFT_196058 [Boeremia exigua]KAH6625190.1 hypothetical protein C7974DRAFT_196058 [Boeremia exigua]
MVSSNLMLWKNPRYDDLRRFAEVPEIATPSWLGPAYRESPRSLSMDATAWMYRDASATPLTGRNTFRDKRTLRFAPSDKAPKSSKWRSWKSRLFCRKSQQARVPGFVSAAERSQPSRRPRSPTRGKRPQPDQGGLTEHLGESRRYRDIVERAWRGVEVLRAKRDVRQEGEAVIESMVPGVKGETSVGIKEAGITDGGQDEVVKKRRKRDVATTILRAVFGFPPQSCGCCTLASASVAAKGGDARGRAREV